MKGHRTQFFRAAVASGAVAVLFATASAAAATETGPGAVSSRQAAGDRNGRWIAYSTEPASYAEDVYSHDEQDGRWGSDLFVTTVGGRTKPVARRGRGHDWNVCPVFSPNGRMLAFARVTDSDPYSWSPYLWQGGRSTIVVVHVGPDGPIRAGRLVLKVRAGRARCPMWSSNSSRLAYLDRGRVVVRDLHGVRRHLSDGDPTIRDFDRSVDELVSPTGDLVARKGPDGTIVSRLDGSDQRVIGDVFGRWTAGWSPDGRKLLFVRADEGGFGVRAVSVDPPFASETVADHGRLDDLRDPGPGYGDVSWQPIPDHRRVAAAAPSASAPSRSVIEIRTLRRPPSGVQATRQRSASAPLPVRPEYLRRDVR